MLTPQLLHPQLAQSPLQEPQLAQVHGDILVGERGLKRGFWWGVGLKLM